MNAVYYYPIVSGPRGIIWLFKVSFVFFLSQSFLSACSLLVWTFLLRGGRAGHQRGPSPESFQKRILRILLHYPSRLVSTLPQDCLLFGFVIPDRMSVDHLEVFVRWRYVWYSFFFVYFSRLECRSVSNGEVFRILFISRVRLAIKTTRGRYFGVSTNSLFVIT